MKLTVKRCSYLHGTFSKTMRTTTQERTVRILHSTNNLVKCVLIDQKAKKFCPNSEICDILRLWSQEFAIAICYAKCRWL